MNHHDPGPGDLDGRVVVVTGGTSGLGRETARVLAEGGATVVFADGQADRSRAAMDWVHERVPGARLDRVALDLADLASVDRAAADVLAAHPRVHVLVNNAVVVNTPLRRTTDGFELHFGVNHLGHFAFTAALLHAMQEAHDPRVVTVTSGVARLARLRWDDPNWRHGRYNRWAAYAQSRLANQVFAVELHRRLRRARSPIASMAAHPGSAATSLAAAEPGTSSVLPARVGSAVSRIADRVVGREVDAQDLPPVFAAAAPIAASGRCYGPAGAGRVRGRPTEVPLVAEARDEDVGARLWDLSVELTGATWPFDEAGPSHESRIA